MAVATLATEGGVFAVWGKPARKDVDRVVQELREAVHEAGHPVLYVTRVPADAPAPDPDVRRYLNAQMGLAAELCSSYHVVLEGVGFMAAMKRGILLTLFQIAGRRKTFFVHPVPDDVIAAVRDGDVRVAEQLLSLARRQRLLDGDPLADGSAT